MIIIKDVLKCSFLVLYWVLLKTNLYGFVLDKSFGFVVFKDLFDSGTEGFEDFD